MDESHFLFKEGLYLSSIVCLCVFVCDVNAHVCVCLSVCTTGHKARDLAHQRESPPHPPTFLSAPIRPSHNKNTGSKDHEHLTQTCPVADLIRAQLKFPLMCQPRCVNSQPLSMTGLSVSVYSISYTEFISSWAIWASSLLLLLFLVVITSEATSMTNKGFGGVSSLLAQMWQSNLLTGRHVKPSYQSYQWGWYQK